MDSQFEELEQRLRQTLRAERAPIGFADRVIEQVNAPRWWQFWPKLVPVLALALALALIALSGWREVERRRDAETSEKAVYALQLTSEKLHLARAIISRHQGERQ